MKYVYFLLSRLIWNDRNWTSTPTLLTIRYIQNLMLSLIFKRQESLCSDWPITQRTPSFQGLCLGERSCLSAVLGLIDKETQGTPSLSAGLQAACVKFLSSLWVDRRHSALKVRNYAVYSASVTAVPKNLQFFSEFHEFSDKIVWLLWKMAHAKFCSIPTSTSQVQFKFWPFFLK